MTNSAVLRLVLAIAAAYGYAVAVRPCLLGRSRLGVRFAQGCASAVMFFPLIIPARHTGLRGLAALVSVELMFKLVDFGRNIRVGAADGSAKSLVRFLVPFPFLSVVMSGRQRRRSYPTC